MPANTVQTPLNRNQRVEAYAPLSSWVKYLPSLSITTACFALHINKFSRERDGDYHHYFSFKLFDINILAFSRGLERNSGSLFSFMGISRETTAEEKIIKFDFMIICFLVVVLFLSLASSALSANALSYLSMLVPLIPGAAEISTLAAWQLSCLSIQAFLHICRSVGHLILSIHPSDSSKSVGAWCLLSPRLWLYAALVPFIIKDYCLSISTYVIMGLLSIFSAVSTESAVASLSLSMRNILSFSVMQVSSQKRDHDGRRNEHWKTFSILNLSALWVSANSLIAYNCSPAVRKIQAFSDKSQPDLRHTFEGGDAEMSFTPI